MPQIQPKLQANRTAAAFLIMSAIVSMLLSVLSFIGLLILIRKDTTTLSVRCEYKDTLLEPLVCKEVLGINE